MLLLFILLLRVLRFITFALVHVLVVVAYTIWYFKQYTGFEEPRMYYNGRVYFYYTSHWDYAIGRVSFHRAYIDFVPHMYIPNHHASYPTVRGKMRAFTYHKPTNEQYYLF